jgi:hypothetical protein
MSADWEQSYHLIHTDDTEKAFTAKDAEDAKKSDGGLGQTHAKLGCLGMNRERLGT